MKFLNRYNISRRIYMIFGLILFVSFLNLIYNIINLKSFQKSVTELSSSLSIIDNLIEAERDAYRSKVAISEALHQENFTNADKLSALIKEVNENKNQVIDRYTKFSKLLNMNQDNNLSIKDESFRNNYKHLSNITDSITNYLRVAKDSAAANLYFTKYKDYFHAVRMSLNEFKEIDLKHAEVTYIKSHEMGVAIIRDSIIIFIIIIILFVLSGYTLTKSISQPINELAHIAAEMSLGKLPDVKIYGNDEIAQMGNSLAMLTSGLKKTASYAQNIGNGNFQEEFTPLSDHDELGHSLIQMKTNLSKFAKEDEQRSWSSNGIANLSEILRNSNLSSEALYFNTLSFIIKYLKANQGGLFVINNENIKEPFIELVASYAYERKKYLQKRIEIGEGLVGQAVIEKEIIYMTKLPNDYVQITSGLGEACPNNILILPLKNNDEVFGVIEIASFQILKEYEIDFVKKISDGIASTISTLRVNEKTHKLLEQSQQMTEELRAQEEEMRQNLEELHATQEEMARKQIETDAQFAAINRTSAYIEFDNQGNIIVANDLFLKTLKYSMDEIIGRHHRIFIDSKYSNSEGYSKFWSDLRNGQSHTGEFKRLDKNGKEIWLVASYTPVFDSNNTVSKIIKLATDITDQKNVQEELNRKQIETDAQFAAINRTSAYIEFDNQGNIIVANDLFLNTLKYSLDEIQGKHHRMFVDSAYANSNEYVKFWNDLRSGNAHTGEFRRLNKNGEEIWLVASYTPVLGADNEVTKIIKLASDVTEQKLKNEELNSQFEKLQKELLDKSEKEIVLTSEINELKKRANNK